MRFFDDDNMDFATRCVLSGVRHGMAEVGETLTTVGSITDGDPDSWLEAFVDLGRRLRTVAETAAAARHGYSAWNAALRSSNYLYAGLWWAPVTAWADKRSELFDEHRSSWDLAVAHWPSPVWPIRVPHESVALPGVWFHSPASATDRAPTIVIVQGLGTPISDVLMTGLDGALSRGHHVLVVDGPGQGAALYRDGLTLHDGWSGVIASLLDWLATRPEVDQSRITLYGVSHGSLFCARAAATERDRIAALVLDPAVTDLGTDAAAAATSATTDYDRRLLAGTTTDPTGTTSLADAVTELSRNRIETRDLAQITCPIAIVRSEDAGGFAGQSDELLAGLRSTRAHVIELSVDDGAGMDQGLDASQVHDAAVFDWLNETLNLDAP